MRTTSFSGREIQFGSEARLRVTSSLAALAIGSSASPVFGQDTSTQAPSEDSGPTREIVVVQGTEVDGVAVDQILPVVIGGLGDLLFVNRGFAQDQFLTFNGRVEALQGVTPTFQLNLSQPFYSIDSGGNTIALATGSGIATGVVGSDDNATLLDFSANANSQGFTNLGNLTSGASPLIVGDRIAVLVSGVGSSGGDTENIIVYADALNPEFDLPLGLFDLDDSYTSLNFAGPNGLITTTTPLLASANSAETSTLLRLDISSNISGDPLQIGPRGNPQQGTDFLRGGDVTFDGFTFLGTVGADGLATFGDGARFVPGEFSANSQRTAFVLDNALVGLDGSNSPDAPGQVLAIDDTVIALASTLSGVQNQTTLGAVNFVRFDDVLLAETGEIYFRQTGRSNEAPAAENVGIWRIVNPGEASQIIEPVLAIGDELLVDAGTLNLLFPESGAPADGKVRIAGFVSGTQERIGNLTSDGRPRFISVNAMGHIATMVQIESNFGLRDALIAQDVDGNFRLVAFVGQLIDIEGPQDQAFITSIRAQFGSNDVDGAGDLYNSSEQLGFLVTLDDAETSNVENLNAVLRVSLNGLEMADFDAFLWDGACGDDEFFTQCNNNNFVNLLDPDERADELPGLDNSDARVVVRGTDIRIATADLTIKSLQSDSKVTLQEGRTLKLGEDSSVATLIVQEGAVASKGGTLSIGTLSLEEGKIAANSNLRVTSVFDFGGLSGEPAVEIEAGATVEVVGAGGSNIARVNVLGSEDEASAINGTLRLTNANLTANTIAPLQIGSAGRLEVTQASLINLEDGTIRGAGTIEVRGSNAQLFSTGNSEISSKLEFVDTQSLFSTVNPSLVVQSGQLSLSDTVFKRTGSPTISRAESTAIDLQNGLVELLVKSGSTLSIENQAVKLQGLGKLTVNGTLDIAAAGLLENLVDLDLENGVLTGEGLLINRGTIAVGERTDPFSDANPFLITNPFAALEDARFSGSRPIVFDISEQDASQTAIDIEDLAFEAVFGRTDLLSYDISDFGLVLASSADNLLRFNQNVVISGDSGVAFGGTVELLGGESILVPVLTFNVSSDSLFAATLTGVGYDATFGGSQAGVLNDIIVPNLARAEDASFFGLRSTVTIANANLIGENLIASGNSTIFNQLASEVALNFIKDEANKTVSVLDPDFSMSSLGLTSNNLMLRGVTVSNVDFQNEGVIRFDDVTFESSSASILKSPSTLRNSGLAVFTGTVSDPDASLSLVNKRNARTEFGLKNATQNIVRIDNEGAIFFSGGSSYSVEAITGNGGFYSVAEGTSVSILDNIFVKTDQENAGLALFGDFDVDGTVSLSAPEGTAADQQEIVRLAAGSRLVIGSDGRIGSIDANGSGLKLIEGTLLAAGRYTSEGDLAVRGAGASARFDRGLAAKSLSVGENASFVAAGGDTVSGALLKVDSARIDGQAEIRGDAEIQELIVAGTFEGGNLETASLSVTGTATVDRISGLGNLAAAVKVGTETTNGELRADDATLASLEVAAGSRANFFGNLTITNDENTQIDGRVTGVGDTASLIGLDLSSTGVVIFRDFTITGTGTSTIAGVLAARDTATFAGDVRVTGRLTADETLTVKSLSSVNGTLNGGDYVITGGTFEMQNAAPTVERLEAPFVRDTGSTIGNALAELASFFVTEKKTVGLDLKSAPNAQIDSLTSLKGPAIVSGALVIRGTTDGSRALVAGDFNSPGFIGNSGSYTLVNGSAFFRGGLTLANQAMMELEGAVSGTGLLRQADSAVLLSRDSILLQRTTARPIESTNGIEPNRSLARTMAVDPIALTPEENPDAHFIGGFVFADGEIGLTGADTIVAFDGILASRDGLVLDDALIDGFVLSEGDMTAQSITISDTAGLLVVQDSDFETLVVDGLAITNGTLTAQDVTVSGQLEFTAGDFGTLTIADGGMLFGNDFTLSGDFTNLGTFLLGSLDNGPGQFSVDGLFVNGGVFSGTGTLDGSLLQAAQDGGPAGNELLFSPGFSPGILNITGDATFDQGMVFMEIGGLTPGTEHDQINVGGALTFGREAMLVIDLLETENGEPFLLETGQEVVLFTARDISPDDVEQINFAILDTLPIGFALVPDISTTADGEILRVVRGFSGSTLSELPDLDVSQAGVAGAIDFLSTAESGVPSQAVFDLAVGLQFADSLSVQVQTLTELGATNLSAMQSTALRAGRYNMDFMTDRLSVGVQGGTVSNSSVAGTPPMPALASQGGSPARGAVFNERDFAQVATQSIQRSGGVSYLGADESRLSLVGSVAVHFGDQDSRGGTVGFAQDGWSASLGAEYESADAALLFGAAATLGESDAVLENSLGETSSQSIGVGLYAAYDAGPVRLAAAASAVDLNLESQRAVQGANAAGETDGGLLAFHLQAFAPVVRTAQVTFGPKVAFDWQDLTVDGFREAGAGDVSLILSELDRKASAFTLSAAGDFGFDIGRSKGALQLDIGYQIATAGEDFGVRQVAFQGAPATSFGAALRPLANDGLRLRGGLTFFNDRGLRVRAVYDGLFAVNGQRQNTVQAEISLPF